jgi:hypothetical protein
MKRKLPEYRLHPWRAAQQAFEGLKLERAP